MLGVNLNMSKTLYSDASHIRVEFAKRIFYNGDEISGLKFDILKGASRSIYMLIDLLRVAKLRS
jgi:hypothetical protein